MTKVIFAFAILSCMFASTFADIHCLDREGNPTAWFVNLKFPKSLRKTTEKYAYLDPNSGDEFNVITKANIDGPAEALSQTFALINTLPADAKDLVLFNDETPGDDAKGYGAHAKGVIAYDPESKTGVYISHSLPGYPRISARGVINPLVDEDNDKYAQHVYCVSLDEEAYEGIKEALPIEKPSMYYKSGDFENLPKKVEELTKVTKFKLNNGEKQTMFTKAPKFEGFLYEDIIIPEGKVELAVQSWGRPYQGPICDKKKSSVNINSVAFNSKDTWTHGADHSKWAVSTGTKKLACFCDMNRMDSQMKRGGSCMCSENKNLHKALKNIIGEVDLCEISE